MSESEVTDSKLDVEDGHTAESNTDEETKVKTETNVLKSLENDSRDSQIPPNTENHDAVDDMDAEGESEAETLIQSPEKKRNSVADGTILVHPIKVAGSDNGSIVIANTSDKENATRKRKRSQDEASRRSPSPDPSHRSSSLSSPVPNTQSDAESEPSLASETRVSSKRRSKPRDLDMTELPKKRRRRPSEAVPPSPIHKRSKRSSIDTTTERRETRSATYPRPSDDEKSASPEPISRREHRRGASTQLTTGEFEKKKRGRPPLINTRRNRSMDRASNSSDESEPRTSRSRPHLSKFASNDNDTMSPAKVGPRKWKDKNGRTYLARACANNDLEMAKVKLAERREDLNMADNAGNTPLQIAALEGFETIVEYLLSVGADVNVRNVDKDTPLIDAVENGHIEVIKLLLKYGANPRMGNAKGDEPYELVHPDDEAREEIRGLLADAKDKDAKKTPGVDPFDIHNRDGASSRAASAASPRDSPPNGPRSPPAFSSRRRTGRSESTRNDLLWQANTQENLAKLASKGDVQGVANILSILEKAETESLIAAAKAGHEEVLQLLIAMGKPDPDPEPVRSSKIVPGYNTPILAAIGRGHPDVVKLLANQSGFNPMRKHREKTYFELAKDRHGERWEEEYNILKQAYERARNKKSTSPRKTRDLERTKPRRRSSSVNSANRQMPSPAIMNSVLGELSPKERRKLGESVGDKPKEDNNIVDASIAVTSDIDLSLSTMRKGNRTRRSQSDLPPPSILDNEPTQKRRRLVTGKEHRNRHTISTSSDNEDTEAIEVKQEEKFQPPLKRGRVSSTPEPAGENLDRKKRRTVLESSPEETRLHSKTTVDTEPTSAIEPESNAEESKVMESHQPDETIDSNTPTPGEAVQTKREPSIANEPDPVQDPENLPNAVEAEDSEDPYSPPPAVEHSPESKEAERLAQQEAERIAAEEEMKRQQQIELEAEQKRLEQEKAAEEARLKLEAEARRKQEEEAQALRRQEEENKERLRQELESRRRIQQQEQERRRMEALPIVLERTARMIDDNDPEVRSAQWIGKFLPLYCVTTKQLDFYCPSFIADEQWVPNFQIAGLLAIKDLNLLNFTSFDKRPVTGHERRCIWRVARLKLAYDFNPLWTTTVTRAAEIESVAQDKFMNMKELFWVKLSDFLEQVPRFPHLNRPLPRQSISLKSYNEILSPRMKTGLHQQQHHNLPNGIDHTNGENGIT